MTQTTNRLFDEIAKMMTDATGAAQGLRGEVENLVRSQACELICAELTVQMNAHLQLGQLVLEPGHRLAELARHRRLRPTPELAAKFIASDGLAGRFSASSDLPQYLMNAILGFATAVALPMRVARLSSLYRSS